MPPDINELIEQATKEIQRVGADNKATLDGVHKRMDGIESAMKRAGHSFQETGAHESAEVRDHKVAFTRFIRRGDEHGLKDLERVLQQKTMLSGSDPDGGFWVNPDISQRVISRVQEISPMRRLATVVSTGSDRVEFLGDWDLPSVAWTGELEARPNTSTPALNKKSINVRELYAAPLVTQQLLDDANFDVDTWLIRKLSTAFAVAEGKAFLLGDGVIKPKGLLTYPAGTTGEAIRQMPTGAANGFTVDSLIDATMSIPAAYREGAVWMLSRSAQTVIRKMKDSTGALLWQPALISGQPDRLLGYPVASDEALPDLVPGSLSAVFGNIAEAYTIVDRSGISVARDPYSKKPFVEFYTRRRVGGDVLNFEAVTILKTGVA